MDDPVSLLMLALGAATHVLKRVVEARASDARLSLRRYLADHPYQTALSVIGAVVGYVALAQTGALTPITAYGAGYMAESLADVIGTRAAARVGS